MRKAILFSLLCLLSLVSCHFVFIGGESADIPLWGVGYWIDDRGREIIITASDIEADGYSLSNMLVYGDWYIYEQDSSESLWTITISSFAYHDNDISCTLIYESRDMLTMYLEGYSPYEPYEKMTLTRI